MGGLTQEWRVNWKFSFWKYRSENIVLKNFPLRGVHIVQPPEIHPEYYLLSVLLLLLTKIFITKVDTKWSHEWTKLRNE